MPRKKSPKRKAISEKTRAADEKLRESIRYIDLEKFDKLLERAVACPPSGKEK